MWPLNNLRILHSYALTKMPLIDLTMELAPDCELLIDSGAFTAFTKGKAVDITEYEKYLDKVVDKYPSTTYFMLDVIGNPEQTYANYLRMVKDGFSPIPIVTPGAPDAHADHFYQESKVVGLGGLTSLRNSVGYVHKFLQKYPPKKTHLLGFTDRDIILHHKPRQCDSVSWCSAQRFGNSYYVEHGILKAFSKDECCKPGIRKFFAKFSMDPSELETDEAWINSTRPGTNVHQKFSTLATLAYWDALEAVTKTKHFFVCSGDKLKVKLLVDGMSTLLKSKRR